MKNLIYVKGNREEALKIARRLAEDGDLPLNTKGSEIPNFHRFTDWVRETVRWGNPRVFFIGAPLLPAITGQDDDPISEIEDIRFYMNLDNRNVFVCHMSEKNRMYSPLFMPEDGAVWKAESKELSLEPIETTTRPVDFDDIPTSAEPIGAILVADYEC